jgi:membrane protein involved in colicin uptake
MITKDGRDTPIEKLTPDNYIVPKGEERYYHAVIEVVQFDQKTGKRLSKPRVQKFGKKSFEASIQASLRKQGYTVTILHDPNVWIAEQQEKAAAKAKADAEAKAKAEQEKFDAAVAAAVAKELAKAKAAEKEPAAEKKSGRPAKTEKE